MAYFQLKRLFLSLVFSAIRHSCQSSYTEAWLILYVGRLPVKKVTDKNKPATPSSSSSPPSSSFIQDQPIWAQGWISWFNATLSFFFNYQWRSLFKVNWGGWNWSIIWRICISTVHLLPFCFVMRVGLFGRIREERKVWLPPTVCHCTSLVLVLYREKNTE